MNMYAEVIVPVPLHTPFSYSVPEPMRDAIAIGSRVIVPFGRKKFYTAVVTALTDTPPQGVELKEIERLLDCDGAVPTVTRTQLRLWQWVADYYMCSPGEVMRAALPAGLKIESETFIEPDDDWEELPGRRLPERDLIIMETLLHADGRMSVADLERATGLTHLSGAIARLVETGAVRVSEKLVERYAPRRESYVSLTASPSDHDAIHAAFDAVKGAPRQEQALLALIDMAGTMQGRADDVTLRALRERASVSDAIIRAMAQKGLLSIERRSINRFAYTGLTGAPLPELSPAQQAARMAINESMREHDVTLLHGVTSSGKTEIYLHLIDFVLRQGRSVLMLVPEIALTTQITARLQRVFADRVVIYHSKFTDNERVDIYRRLLTDRRPAVVIGARSAVFLPVSSLGLVIVDEEHDPSYKQADPAPRYNARDTAIVLARSVGAKVLLGSATPAIDTHYKATTGRYGLATLTERYAGARLPAIDIVDLKRARLQGQLSGPFAMDTRQAVQRALDTGRQAIVFINRRGYAPVAECRLCGFTPKCNNCDVTLTYHKQIDRLVCHYCGAVYPMSVMCPSCHEPAMDTSGYGTERIEDEVTAAFPMARTLRMDLDSTRSKDGYEQIIADFSQRRADLLVGTQMVTKGLDFGGVSAVAVVNADTLLNRPDFRSAERAFCMLQQVAGRAGRRDTPGTVVIQTRQPEHPLFEYLKANDYGAFYEHELEERRAFVYPPFCRLIYIYIRHRDLHEADMLAATYANHLRTMLGNRVYGPDAPSVGRVSNLYIRKIMLKIEPEASLTRLREALRGLYEWMHANGPASMRSATIAYDVDPV